MNNKHPIKPLNATDVEEYDAIIIGAGVSGLYQLYKLRELGLSVRVFEDAQGVGGTWYWNRYPGCRFDSETETYCYSWSEELLQEWDWKEHYSGQPENERYLNYVADKFNLREDIQLDSRVTSAVYDESASCWEVQVENGQLARAQFLIGAVGVLSAKYVPAFPGVESFGGESFHTSNWPKEEVDFSGKRVACIGTGATAIQLIPIVAEQAGHLTVFQRTANYAAPCRNSEVDPEVQAHWKETYPAIHKKCRQTPLGFAHDFDPRSALEVSEEERLAVYEKLWTRPGFAKWLGNFHDIFTNAEANETFSEFVRNKIRQRVHDPEVAELLVPKDHLFGSKRPPLETHYYEAFNRDNVKLVDIRNSPIQSITATGVKTQEAEYDFDVIIYATGFDAVSGPLTRIDIRGEKGQSFKEKWADGPRNYLGIQAAGFPNFFIGASSAFINYTVCAEMMVEWITDCIGYVRRNNFSSIVPSLKAEQKWVDHKEEIGSQTLLFSTNTKNWFNGGNIPGKAQVIQMYANTLPEYRKEFNESAANDYKEFVLR